MSKSSRIVILVVTVVLAITTFSIIWATRNTEETDLLQQARERQSVPLLIVDKPLTTDPATISAEEKLADEVRALILNDEVFKKNLASALDISNDSVEDMANDISNQIKFDILSEIENYKAEYEAKFAELANREPDVKTITEQITETIIHEVDIDELINQLIEPLTIKVYEQISSDKTLRDSVINEAIDKVGEHLAKDEVETIVVDLYEAYEDEVITQIVSAVLAEIEKDAPLLAPEVFTPTVVDQPKVEEVMEKIEEEAKAEATPAETEKEAEVKDSEMSEEDYNAKRQELREEAIRNILEMIKNNN